MARGLRQLPGGGDSGRRHKYGISARADRTDADGTVFDSRGEMLRWGELRLLERCGEITHLERQVTYDLEVNGMKICRYVADFRYRDGGELVVEDFKSPATRTEAYRIKRKLMKALHGIEILETGRKR